MTWWERLMIDGLERAGRAAVQWSEHPAPGAPGTGASGREPVILVGGAA